MRSLALFPTAAPGRPLRELVGALPELDGYPSLKIALYAEGGEFFHVAKQMREGTWSSKAGVLHDLKHSDLAAFEGSFALRFAVPVVFMKRPDDGRDPMTLEHGKLLLP